MNNAEAILELLYHFRCGHCLSNWTVVNFIWGKDNLVCCPSCGEWNQLPEKPSRFNEAGELLICSGLEG